MSASTRVLKDAISAVPAATAAGRSTPKKGAKVCLKSAVIVTTMMMTTSILEAGKCEESTEENCASFDAATGGNIVTGAGTGVGGNAGISTDTATKSGGIRKETVIRAGVGGTMVKAW